MRTEKPTQYFEPLQKLSQLNLFKPPVINYITDPIFYVTDRSKAVLLFGPLCLHILGSVSVLFSPSIYLDDIKLS